MTKTLLSLSLLCALLTPPLLVFGWFELEKAELRREVRMSMLPDLEAGDLVILELDAEEAREALHWEGSDEFEYQGRMYDVVRTEKTGRSLRFWCWPDEPETRLNRELRALAARLFHDDPEPEQQAGHLLFFLKSLYYSEPATWQPAPLCTGQLFLPRVIQAYAAPVPALPPAPPRLG